MCKSQYSVSLRRWFLALQTYLVHLLNLERLPPWQDRRDPNVCVLVPSPVPCSTSSAFKGEHGLVLGVDVGPSYCMRTPGWKQFESIWTDSVQNFTASVMQFELVSQKIAVYVPTAFLFWEMGTCHVGEKIGQYMLCSQMHQQATQNAIDYFKFVVVLFNSPNIAKMSLDKWKLSVCFFCLDKEPIVLFVIFWFVYCR